mgnify:CR=1 FL=1
MEHIYPAFEQGRIMKRELLLALRDYSYEALQLQYGGFPDGIISGCRVRIDGKRLRILPGMIKCGGFLFLIIEENDIEYAPSDRYASLKFRLLRTERLADYTKYQSEFVLDSHLERKQGEIEVCRFKLKEGALLRTDYKDFYDIQTEYDTVNLADATWSSSGGNTLSKEVTDLFAQKVLECGHAGKDDVQFAYFLLQSKEAVNYDILMDYICRRAGTRRLEEIMGTAEAFGKLADILDVIRQGGELRKEKDARRGDGMIVWE